MSYDLMVFDPPAAPRTRKAFMAWYGEQTRWSESHGYDDPAVATPALRAWFMEMTTTFPAMNGPFASDDEEHPHLTDYSIGRSVIYAAFGWPDAEAARKRVLTLAARHKVGFFDVSASDGDVWRPNPDGTYTAADL